MEWQQLLSDRRLGAEPSIRGEGTLARSEFERDYDRLVFSPPFRRLQNKTQVFPLPRNIFVHNRLTHSLEVSCLGRSLGNIVGQELAQRHRQYAEQPDWSGISSIVSAACLAHDMGNPPFGHSGERAIGAYFNEGNGKQWQERILSEGGRWSDFVFFEGNANAFRLLTHQFKGRRPGGFALTYSTLASILKYPYSSERGVPKFGFFQSEEATMRLLAEELGLIPQPADHLSYARYPLVFLVEAADDICYQVMDIEDAYKLSILSYSEASELLGAYFDDSERLTLERTLGQINDPNEQIGYLRSRVINLLVLEVASIFLDHEEQILSGKLEQPLMHLLSPRRLSAYQSCSQLAKERIYRAKEVVDVELAGHQIFGSLLDKLLDALHHPDKLYSQTLLSRVSSQYDTHQQTTYGRIQCALDYISGMTDIYALDLYRRIVGMNLPAL